MFVLFSSWRLHKYDDKKVESTHATQYSENELPGEQQPTTKEDAAAQSQDACSGSNGSAVVVGAVGTGTDNGVARGAAEIVPAVRGGDDVEKGVVKVPQVVRRSSAAADADGGRGKAGKQRGVGFPMTAVSEVLRQLHMRVLSGDEMLMLDKVRSCV